MDNLEYKKLKSYLNLRKKIQPKTYLDELAESGWLDIYLSNYSKDKLEYDKEYKEKVYDAMYQYSNLENEDVERYFLEQLIESLSYFNEYIKNARI